MPVGFGPQRRSDNEARSSVWRWDLASGKQRERAGVNRMPVGFGLAETARMEVTAACAGGICFCGCNQRRVNFIQRWQDRASLFAPRARLSIQHHMERRARGARARAARAGRRPFEPPYSPKTLQANKKEQTRYLISSGKQFADSHSQIFVRILVFGLPDSPFFLQKMFTGGTGF